MKKLATKIAIVVILLSISISVVGFPRTDHDRHLREVFFGRYENELNEKGRDLFSALKYASYLCIDQYNGGGKAELEELLKIPRKHWFKFMQFGKYYPKDISEIDFTSNYAHRANTHLGWDYDYPNFDKEKNPDWLTKRWPKRKNILLATVEAVFNFNPLPFSIKSERGERMSKLIYYVHLLGDHIDFDNYQTYKNTLKNICPLGGKSSDEVTIISELEEEIEALFGCDASELIKELKNIDRELKNLSYEGDAVSEADFSRYRGHSKKLLEVLSNHLPKLLRNQDFFSKVFYD